MTGSFPSAAEIAEGYFEREPLYFIVVNGRYDIANCGDPYQDYSKADKEFRRLVSERIKKRKTSTIYEIKMNVIYKGEEKTKFSAQFGCNKQ